MIAPRPLFVVALCLALGGAWADDTAANEWNALTSAQRQVLAPLQRDWNSIGDQRRAKWVEVANRFLALPADERERLRERMTEWSRMTPAERGRARLQFQDARQMPQSERQDLWQSYQALPEVERRALAQRAKPAARGTAGRASLVAPKPAAGSGKRNLVQTTPTPPRRSASPTAQQAKPGATTTPMTARAQPPVHNQAGLPKIAATPGFVDPSTLLPQRGPQGAAVRSVKAASPPASSP